MPASKTYIILNQKGSKDEAFPTTMSFAKHLSISTARLKKYMNGRSTLTYEEYEELLRWTYKPTDYSRNGRRREANISRA